jgi:hypothetical protein
MAGSVRLGQRGSITLGAIALLVPLVVWQGCGRLRDKQAVRRYALATRAVEARAGRVKTIGNDLHKIRSGLSSADLRRFLRERYLPALQSLVDEIRRLPVQMSRLGSIRSALLSVAEQTLEVLENLADRSRGGLLEEAWQRVVQGQVALDAAVARHGEALDAICARHDLRRGGK